jgi:ERO1-like protein beta
MRSASQLFYLAVFALWTSPACAASNQANEQSPDVCDVSAKQKSPPPPATITAGRKTYTVGFQYEPNTIVSDACASYASLDNINALVGPQLKSLTSDTDFFSHYRLNLYNKKCPFWSDENGMCGNIACAVNTLDNEEDIPLAWRAEELGKLEGRHAQHPGRQQPKERQPEKPLQGELGEQVGESCVVEYDDECDERDYCVPEDESASSKGDYVSLVDNPEKFTGYTGAGARQVWESIYRENCFSKPNSKDASIASTPLSPFQANPLQAQAANDLLSAMKAQNIRQGVQNAIAQGSSQQTTLHELDFDQECLEKRVFYRVVSGMHASISTHLCYEYLNQTTGKWSPNAECFKSRVYDFPERVSNIYFNYALVLRAISKLNGHLKDYSFCSADPIQDRQTKNKALELSNTIKASGEIFDETAMFQSPDAVGLKEDFKQRFRNISRIMDCVGCDKCRLWGKVQTNGYGTALKILFEFDEKTPKNDPQLRRTELVSLINTLDRLSHSLNAIKYFRDLMETSANKLGSHNQQAENTTAKAAEPSPATSQETDDTLIEEEDEEARLKSLDDMSVMQALREEFALVFNAYRYIIKQWISLPRTIWDIIIWESQRFWKAFLGLNPGKRGWSIHIPRRDEL